MNMQQYLEATHYIDWQQQSVYAKAKQLANRLNDEQHIAEACFKFVRDEIKHSWDYQLNSVTCIASDVLKYETGYCYAKSHLLAALLRANEIPAGLCYQRLTISDDKPPFCLHGLNAIFLEQYGWYRVDARGNNSDVESGFTPPVEKLAYPAIINGEADLPEIWAEPLSVVIQVLENGSNYLEVADNLPDIMLYKASDLSENK